MATDMFKHGAQQSMAEAFPDADPGVQPLGGRILVQMRRSVKTTKSGIVLVAETSDTVKWNQQTARVVAMGPLAYRNRETLKPWSEGAWVEVGDFVRVPRWNGDRVEVEVQGSDEPIVFVTFNDHEVIAKVTKDPLSQQEYIL